MEGRHVRASPRRLPRGRWLAGVTLSVALIGGGVLVTRLDDDQVQAGAVTCDEVARSSTAIRCADSSSDSPPRSDEPISSTSGQPGSLPMAAPPSPAVPADPDRPGVILDAGADVPNPLVLVDGGRYWMFATQTDTLGGLYNVPVKVSDDQRSYQLVADALPTLPPWAVPVATWAPDVLHVGDEYVMFFTARVRDRVPDTQCIGRAVSTRVEGPYTPDAEPFVCQLDRGGSIDPRSFTAADGGMWLLWKSDDNSDVEGTSTSSIYSRRLTDDAAGLVGEPVRLLEVDQPWEGRIVEAPQLVAANGQHWLFYSGNWFNSAQYGIGLASCDGPSGPCTKPFDGPWLRSNLQGEGPGEASLYVDLLGVRRIVYAPLAQRYEDPTPRPAAAARVEFDERGPFLAEF